MKKLKFDKLYKFFIISGGVIILDQAVKMIIYFTMEKEEEAVLFDWFKIHFTTNPGMAFGLKINGEYGKIILSLFRLAAIVFIGYYVKKLYLKNAHKGLIICVAFIFGGAMGNLIDSTFYAYLDDQLLMVANQNDFKLFHGKVIDMFFLDIAEGYYPDNWPLVGGNRYSFWPIFNIADAAIFVSVFVIFFKQKTFFKKPASATEESETPTEKAPEAVS